MGFYIVELPPYEVIANSEREAKQEMIKIIQKLVDTNKLEDTLEITDTID